MPEASALGAINDSGARFGEMGWVPDAENPGWYIWGAGASGRFNDIFGAQRCRVENGKVRVRFQPEFRHTNFNDTLHGGFILALIDHVIFIAPVVLGVPRVLGGVTIELSTKFFAVLKPDAPIEIVFEVLRETGGMIFSGGVIEQDGAKAVAFSGITKKAKAAG